MDRALNTLPHPPRAGVALMAAGRGERLGSAWPKQFLPLAGRPLFAYSLRLFDALPYVTQIVLVLPETGVPEAQRHELAPLTHPLVCVTGGARRQDSVAAGLAALTVPCDLALIHDVARPFADPVAIERLARLTMLTGGGLLALRSPDTVKRADAENYVAETIDRAAIWLAQTPQSIRADLVPRAIAALRRSDCTVTDEASLLEQWGIKVALVESSARNFKITHQDDLAWAEALLMEQRQKINLECGRRLQKSNKF